MNMWNFKSAYPVHVLPADLQDFIHCVAASTKTSEDLVAPVVLAAAAAAVQGVVDVKAPFGASMPTSLFFGVVVRSGDRKSSVLDHVLQGFEEFEQGMLMQKGDGSGDLASSHSQSHPFVLESTTEAGVIDLFRLGAKSVFYAPDEGGVMLQRLDMPFFCKRFDGATIRHITRKEGAIVLPDRRASVCMLIQDLTFYRFMSKKGDLMIESGFLPRLLMSFATRQPATRVHSFASQKQFQDPHTHPFHERSRSLLREYVHSLNDPNSKREQLVLTARAVMSWGIFDQEMEQMLVQGDFWSDVRPFVRRAGEHVLRLAAVLQWFSAPQLQVEQWAVDAAADIVKWHLAEAKVAFGEPPLSVQVQQWSETLYDYLLRRASMGQTSFARSELLRCAPVELRKADRLSMAVQHLLNTYRITVGMQRNKEFIILNAPQLPRSYLAFDAHESHGAGYY